MALKTPVPKYAVFLDGRELPYGVDQIGWSYRLRTTTQDTLGGRVIQLLGIESDRLRLKAQSGSRQNLLRVAERVQGIMAHHIQTHAPVELWIPQKNWRFSVYVNSMPSIGDQVTATSYPYTLTCQVDDDFGLADNYLLTTHFDKLQAGIGYTQGYHGGADALASLTSGEFIFDSGLDDPVLQAIARLRDFQAGGSGRNQVPYGADPSTYGAATPGYGGTNGGVDVGPPVERGTSPRGYQNRLERYDHVQLAKLARGAGLATYDAIYTAVGVALRESGGNTWAFNDGTSENGDGLGRDYSCGFWQINMKGSLMQDRLARYNLRSFEDLFIPQVNARVMSQMSNQGTSWSPWTIQGDHTRGISSENRRLAAEAARQVMGGG